MSNPNASGENQTNSSSEEPKKNLPVEPEVYTRIMGELKAAQAKLKALEAEKSAQEDKKLKDQNEWKILAEAKEKALAEMQGELSGLKDDIVNSYKINAFQKLLGGKIKNSSYYQFVDTSKIAYDVDKKEVDQGSLKLAVAEFLKHHSALVDMGVGKMPSEASTGATVKGKPVNELSMEELKNEIRKLGKI